MLPSRVSTVFSRLDAAGRVGQLALTTLGDPLNDRRDDELDALRTEIAEVRASRRRLAIASDAERRSIERTLHEGVQQILVALAANLEFAAASMESDPAATRELIGEMKRDVGQALEEMRTLATRIYPPLLEAVGLVAALRSAADSANVRTRIDVASGLSCPPEIAGAVYFCFLDVLDRAVAGTPGSISVRNEDGALAFDVVAECDVDELAVRDRVEALGGRVTIRRGSGREISVAGSLPLSG